MAIDSQAKRNSAIATRRLPWFRRFAPIPDGSVDQGDRQQLAFVYRGITVAEAVPLFPADTTIARTGPADTTITRSGPAQTSIGRRTE